MMPTSSIRSYLWVMSDLITEGGNNDQFTYWFEPCNCNTQTLTDMMLAYNWESAVVLSAKQQTLVRC